MQINNLETRQGMGCGYEPPVEHAITWRPPAFPSDETITTCAGYTVRLPEVIEAARARVHWTKGELESFVEGRPHENLLIAIEILEGSAGELQVASVTPIGEGGLSKGAS